MLDAGSVVAKLDLDDPSKVQQAQPCTAKLPRLQNPSTTGQKLHQVFQSTRAELDNLLAGYTLPEPHNRKRVKEAVVTLMKCLKDPTLPLLELQVYM